MIRRITSLLLVGICLQASARAETPPAAVPRTGQTACYGITGAAVACAGTGQDGETLTGLAWPDPRFADNGDRTVTDRLTGLSWTRDADPADGPRTWAQALDYVKTLNGRKHLGHGDWRLPNVNELESLVAKRSGLVAWLRSQGFDNVRTDYYWTSTTYAGYTGAAWSVGMYSGILAGRAKAEGGFTWPVRGGRAGALTLPATGQTACYDGSDATIPCAGTGQDGERRAGAAWPSPRFTENADGTVGDGLTGLVWSRDGRAPGPDACGAHERKTLRGALDHVACLNANNYLGRNDWRLPNRNEMASLVNRGQPDSAAWLNTQGFSDVQADSYWSSTAYPYNTWNAWSINMRDGAVTSCANGHKINVWPVRGGR